MVYTSTRGESPEVSGADMLLTGLAPDGGLYVPTDLPEADMVRLADRDHGHFSAVASALLESFLPELSPAEIRDICFATYTEERFGENPARLIQLNPYNEQEHLLLLDDGPTGSYKDYALQLLPRLLGAAAARKEASDKMLLVTVTSGNTGNAALYSMSDRDDVALMVFFPQQGLTALQVSQMVSRTSENCYVSSSTLTFDQLQVELRSCLTDSALRAQLGGHGVLLSTANSLNFGRLIPQIALYFHAYGQLLRQDKIIPGEKINFVIPAGNLGNAVAGWYAARMGLPVERFILASNKNRGVLDFVKNGRIRPSRRADYTLTPGMDVLMPANVERLLYSLADPSTKYAAAFSGGRDFSLDGKDQKEVARWFVAGSVEEEQTLRAIRSIYDRTDYALDPHTAAAIDVYERFRESTGDQVKTVFVNIASPLRYAHTVGTALFGANAVKNLADKELTVRLATEIGLEDELQKWQGETTGAVPKLAAGDMRRTILEQLGIY